MRADLKSLYLEPATSTLPSDPAEFAFLARMTVGPSESADGETFDITVCTPEWLAQSCRAAGGIFNPRHHLVVNFEEFDKRALHAWLAARVQEVQGDTWTQIGEQLGRLGHWEFEDSRP